MPGKSRIDQLPTEAREALDARLDAEGRDAYPAILDTLRSMGVAISEGTLDRYYRQRVKLRQPIEKLKTELRAAGISPLCTDAELSTLLMELGALHLRERTLIARLMRRVTGL